LAARDDQHGAAIQPNLAANRLRVLASIAARYLRAHHLGLARPGGIRSDRHDGRIRFSQWAITICQDIAAKRKPVQMWMSSVEQLANFAEMLLAVHDKRR
jgi:hypothetical protein